MKEIQISSLSKNTKLILLIKDKPYAAHNYQLMTIKLMSSAFNADLDRVRIEETELKGFVRDLIKLEEVRQGEIALSAENPDEFTLGLKSIDRLGHFEAELHLGIGEGYKNSLNVSFEIDPSSLPVLLMHLQGCEDSYKDENKMKTGEYKHQAKIINEFLEEWDFIGVISSQHKDEYSDLVNPILRLLKDNATEDALSDMISKTITDTYNFRMDSSDEDVQRFAKRVIAWWKNDN